MFKGLKHLISLILFVAALVGIVKLQQLGLDIYLFVILFAMIAMFAFMHVCQKKEQRNAVNFETYEA